MTETAKKLHLLFKKFGGLSLQYRQKCIGMLPEIFKLKIHENLCMSAFEYAAKFAGISNEQVRVTLRLEKKFEDKPILKKLLNEGEVSINKLARIASIATTENEELLAEQVKLLPTSAVETMVKDIKYAGEKLQDNTGTENQIGLIEPLSTLKSLPGQDAQHARSEAECDFNEELEEDIKKKLCELRQKGINMNDVIREALTRREQEIERQKNEIAEDAINNHCKKIAGGENNPRSRYISVKIRRILKEEFGTKCSVPNCHNPAEEIHHTERFAMNMVHNPHFLAPVCRNHHIIAHTIDMAFHKIRMSKTCAKVPS
jgi:hypothetical protein